MAIYALLFFGMLLGGCADITISSRDAANLPPPIPREFRAAWVATVANIDWPSKKGLTVAQQRQEIVRIVERAKELNLNALIFQVRPAADAMYISRFEPWSEYLTGEQGKTPEPLYDPLATWIEESHKRGIELHAWFNPYRARHTSAKGPLIRTHIANTNPAVVKEYGGYLWMDPGEPVAAQRTLDVILDVVRRYDIDGVHIDDYFYPYPVPVNANTPVTENTPEVDFPDEPSWTRYLLGGGKLSRADWRRQNVNDLIERLHTGIHGVKPWMRFGVSPFGLGRPDRRPPGITGFSQYDKIYADVELWLKNAWMDYLAPQLYWPIDQPQQAFGTLMEYWIGQNTARRHIWPGMFTSRIDASPKSWKPEEIVNQVALMRTRKTIDGHIHFSMAALMENRRGIADQLKAVYATPALIPVMPWHENDAPAMLSFIGGTMQRDGKWEVEFATRHEKPAWWFAVWIRYGKTWRYLQVPSAIANGAGSDFYVLRVDAKTDAGPIDRIVISAVGRLGNESPRTTVAIDADKMKLSP